MDKTEQLERTLDKESITFKELKEGILKYRAKSEYQQAAIVIIRGVLEKRLNERSGLNKHIIDSSVCDHPFECWESVMGDGVLCTKCHTVIKQN